MQTIWRDLRFAVRVLLRQPGFAVVAVLTLALGIGANSATFSVVNAVLLRPLPFLEPEKLIKLWESLPQGGFGTVSVPNLKDWREQNDVFTGIAAWQSAGLSLQGAENPERVLVATVSANFFDVVGVGPQLGRGFQAGEDEPGKNRLVILSHALWQRNFGADAAIVGKNILLGGESYTVVGVMPANFRYPSRLMQAGVFFERTADGEGDKLIIHGQAHRSLSISLDGVDTQDNYNRASSIMLDQPLIQLTAENVQEFKVITGLGTAENGRGGAHISAVTRAGGNKFHGSLSWFHRNTVFNANEYFNNSAQPKVERPPLIRNQFAGRISGPIFKDKTFFFAGFEAIRESRGIPVLRTVYTAEARQGIFRYLDDIGTLGTTPEAVAANPGRVRGVNLFTCGASIRTELNRDCVDSRFNAAFPATVDPTVAKIMALVPLPNNFDVGDGLNTGGFRFNAKSITGQDTPSFRLDHRFNDMHSFYGTFNYLDRRIPAAGPSGQRSAGLSDSGRADPARQLDD